MEITQLHLWKYCHSYAVIWKRCTLKQFFDRGLCLYKCNFLSHFVAACNICRAQILEQRKDVHRCSVSAIKSQLNKNIMFSVYLLFHMWWSYWRTDNNANTCQKQYEELVSSIIMCFNLNFMHKNSYKYQLFGSNIHYKYTLYMFIIAYSCIKRQVY